MLKSIHHKTPYCHPRICRKYLSNLCRFKRSTPSSMMCMSPRVKYLKKAYALVTSGTELQAATRCRGGTMAPVACDHNRCNYVWKFLIHPIMFDNSPAFHVNCQCFAAHGPVSAPFNFSCDKFASERLYTTIDWFITHEDRTKNFFNPEYIRIEHCL